MAVGNHSMPSQLLTSCSDGLLYCFSKWAMDVTNGAFWTLALLSFAFVIFMATLRYGSNRAFGFGSFVGMVGAIWLAILQFMAWWVASAFILVGVVGIAIMMMSEE